MRKGPCTYVSFLDGLLQIIEGPGLDGVCSIYQGHLFLQKATYGLGRKPRLFCFKAFRAAPRSLVAEGRASEWVLVLAVAGFENPDGLLGAHLGLGCPQLVEMNVCMFV